MSSSLIPGERDILPAEMRLIRDLHALGHTAAEIAELLPGVEEIRVAQLLAPKRPPARKVWKGRRR